MSSISLLAGAAASGVLDALSEPLVVASGAGGGRPARSPVGAPLGSSDGFSIETPARDSAIDFAIDSKSFPEPTANGASHSSVSWKVAGPLAGIMAPTGKVTSDET